MKNATQFRAAWTISLYVLSPVLAVPLFGAPPSVTIMARSGTAELKTIDPNIAINREGIIAFTGTDSTGSRVFVVSQPGEAMPVVPAVTGRTYAGVGITSGPNPGVVYRDLVSGSPTGFILRESFVPGPLTVILGSSVSVSGPADWDSITSNSIDVSSTGTAVVSGLINGSIATALFIGNTRPLTQAAVFSGAVGLRPQISDSGEAVIRDNTGRIVTWNVSGQVRLVAGASNGFDMTTGNRPGISADGSAIAFSGNYNNTGSGIYALITPDGYSPMLVPVAGGRVTEGTGTNAFKFTDFANEQRVGVRAFHYDLDGGGSGDNFTVVFQASKNGVAGVYARDITVTNGILQPLGPAIELVKVGDFLPGLSPTGLTVTGFTLYRSINNDGTIAFTVTLSDGSTAIVTTSPYLQGVDYLGSASGNDFHDSNWCRSIYANDGKRFVIVNAWRGITSNSPTALNYDAARSTFDQIAAYAEINFNNKSKEIDGAPPGTDQNGQLQIAKAFQALNGRQIAFMGIAVEDLDPLTKPTRIPPNAAVARIADAVWATWTQGVPAVMYTRKTHWNSITGGTGGSGEIGSDEISGASVPLWDVKQVKSLDDSINGYFDKYGMWTSRIGRQWNLDTTLEGKSADLDSFDPRAFSLPRPQPGCKPALFISNLTLGRLGSGLALSGTIYNDGRAYGISTSHPQVCDALATRINQATLLVPGLPAVSSGYTAADPYKLKTIPAFDHATFTIPFFPPTSIVSGAPVAVQLQLSCGGLKLPARSYRLSVP